METQSLSTGSQWPLALRAYWCLHSEGSDTLQTHRKHCRMWVGNKRERQSLAGESVKGKVAQSRLTLRNPINYTVHGILQARILEWVAIPFSRGSSKSKHQTRVSLISGRFFTSRATREPLTRCPQISSLGYVKSDSPQGLERDYEPCNYIVNAKLRCLCSCFSIYSLKDIKARTWCTGKTQRDRMEREVGGGIGMGNTCISKADSCQWMTKTTTIL